MSTTTAPRENRTTGSGPVAPAKSGGAGKDADQDAAKDKAAKGKFFKSKKFIIAVVGLLVVGGGAYKFAMPHKAAPPTGGDVVAIDAMTVNLAGGHYLKVAAGVQLVKGKATATEFQSSHAAELVIDEFSNRSVRALSTNKDRKELTAELAGRIKAAYPGEVYAIYLTQFVTQ